MPRSSSKSSLINSRRNNVLSQSSAIPWTAQNCYPCLGHTVTYVLATDRSLAPPSWATFHRSVSAEHNLDCSLNGGGLGLYAGAELIFRGGFKGDGVGTMIEGEIRGFGHDRELFVPNTTLD